ncbi:MAG: AAA family ATPase [Syntrophaceae bacterium]|nr:AAA family ATPase [Syntrophaceae bacterium]
MYTWFYGFSEEPFNANPDPAFLYWTETHRRAFDEMVRAIQERKGWALVLGELGSGKTTLVQHLANTLEPKTLVTAIFHPPGTMEDLLEEILRKLGVPSAAHDKESLVLQLNEYLQRLTPEETLALVIDDAQEMSPELMKEFIRLASPENSAARKLQVILVGQPELREILKSEDLKGILETVEVQAEIHPLSEKESRLYLSHRLEKADSGTDRVFTPDALELIVKYGRGNPRKLNILCDNSFLIGYGLSKKRIDSAIVTEVLENSDFVGEEERIGWKSEEVLKPKTLAQRFKGSLFRKLAYALLALAGVGAIILVGRLYLKGPEEEVSTRFPIQPGPSKEAGAPEAKPQPVAKAPLQPGAEKKPSAAAPEPASPAIAEKQPVPPAPKAEVTPAVPPSSPEVKPSPGKPESPAVPAEKKPSPKPETKVAVLKPLPPRPPSPETKEGAPAKKVVMVKGKDTLYSIGLQNYGIANTSIVDQILEANPQIEDPNKLANQQSIRLPEIREESLLIPLGDGAYQVRLGAFLKPEYAAFLKAAPSLRGKTVELLPRKLPSGETWYRAVAGKYNTREEGLKIIQELRGKGLSPYFPEFRMKK